jgi:uncharacterized membrane protein YcaP (DUF421 family)
MNSKVIQDSLLQALLAVAYYAVLVTVMRLAGKRLAGQTTTFDLVVLITISVVLQTTALRDGVLNALVFIATVFGAHHLLAMLCARSTQVRNLVRGCPRPLIRNAQVDLNALTSEGLSYDELLAGLRKLGYSSPEGISINGAHQRDCDRASRCLSPKAGDGGSPKGDSGPTSSS